MSCDRAANTPRWPGAEQLSRVRLRDRSVQVCTSPPGHPTAPQPPAHGDRPRLDPELAGAGPGRNFGMANTGRAGDEAGSPLAQVGLPQGMRRSLPVGALLSYSGCTVSEAEEARMGLDELKTTAEGLKHKAEDLVGSTLKDEAKTDSALDAVSGAVKKATGGKFDDKIDAARSAADKKLGSE